MFMDSDDDRHDAADATSDAPPVAHDSLAQQLHAVAEDPQIMGAAGLLVGGVSPVAGLALGLKAAHDEQAQGKPTSLLTKFAIGRSVLGLAIGVIALIFFLIMAHSIMGHVNNFPTNVGNFPGNNFELTCANVPKPTSPAGLTWHCANGVWTGTSGAFP